MIPVMAAEHLPCADPVIWSLDIDASHSSSSDGAGAWSSESTVVSRRTRRSALALRLERNERFDDSAVYGEVRHDRALGTRSSVYVLAGRGAGADYAPTALLGLGGETRLGDSTTLLAGAAVGTYVTGDSLVMRLGLRRELTPSSGVLIHTLSVSGPDGDSAWGHALAVDWRPSDAMQIRAAYTHVPEFDGRSLEDVETASIGATLQLRESLAVRAQVMAEHREVYSRLEWALGFALRI